jgi:hypothetical protein
MELHRDSRKWPNRNSPLWPPRRSARDGGGNLRLVHEGFDTPELKDAKALPDELSAAKTGPVRP